VRTIGKISYTVGERGENEVGENEMPNAEERLRLLRLLSQNPQWRLALSEALEVEAKAEPEYTSKGLEYYGWEWYEVHTPVPTLNKMVAERILDVALSTRSGNRYRVRDRETLRAALEVVNKPLVEAPPAKIPEDLFDIIVGHENIKTLIRYAIEATKPTHFLLQGSPASAKTLFLLELSRLPNAVYALAPTLTAAGLADLLFMHEPEYLLIDEIDRLQGQDLGVLNSLMATGRVAETKFKRRREIQLQTKVFAAGIRVQVLPKDLLSRFVKLRFKPYIEKQFIDVSVHVLETLESVPPEVSELIAKTVWDMTHEASDVRQCVMIARLAEGSEKRAREVLNTIKQLGWSERGWHSQRGW